MARYTAKHVTAWLLDKTGTKSVLLGPGSGEFSLSNLMEAGRGTATVMDHGKLDGRVYTDEVENEWSVTVNLPNRSIVHATEARVLNAVLKTGLFEGAQTTDPGGQVWAPALRVKLEDEVGNIDWILCPSNRVSAELGIATDNSSLTLSGSNLGKVLWGDDAAMWPSTGA